MNAPELSVRRSLGNPNHHLWDSHRGETAPKCEITVSADKSAEQIATDIKPRLLPEHVRLINDCLAAKNYTIWPDRVKAVCKSDRSIAIAHGQEDLCDVKAPEKQAKRGKKKAEAELEMEWKERDLSAEPTFFKHGTGWNGAG